MGVRYTVPKDGDNNVLCLPAIWAEQPGLGMLEAAACYMFFCLLVCECSSALGVCLEREVNMAKKKYRLFRKRDGKRGREEESQSERGKTNILAKHTYKIVCTPARTGNAFSV